MVDTPRTVAELLALYADNETGAISPQDLRDLVVSITNPVPQGGFGHGASPLQRVGGFYAPSSDPVTLDSNNYFIDWSAPTASEDPQGWLQSSTYGGPGDAYGIPGPYAWFLLPPGVYGYHGWINTFSDPVGATNEYAGTYLDYLEYPDTLDPVMGGNVYEYPLVMSNSRHGAPPSTSDTMGWFRVPETDTLGAPVTAAACAFVGYWNTGATQVVTSRTAMLIQL